MSGVDSPFDLATVDAEHLSQRPGLVVRDAVLSRLASTATSGAASLVLLVAPAGYGKTTALSQWASQDPRRFAWVSLADADNDPARLLRHIVTALHRLEPIDDPVLTSPTSRDAALRGVVMPRLLAWLAGHSGDRVLVLDDLQLLHNPVSLAVIGTLASQLPPGWQLAIASRSPAGVFALRGQRRTLEVGPEDLAFTVAEAGTVLAEAGVAVPAEAVRSLVRRTEGWPAGIYLTALRLRDTSDPAIAASLIDDEAPLADYLREQVLDGQGAETVRFLLQSAVLERMSGPLCDAVLATTGSAARLERIANSNLFVVSQDRRGEWYRCHRLFAELLLSELRRREPAQELVLHRRAAAWFAERGLPEEAIGHALAGQDPVTAAKLTTMYTQIYANTGRLATARRWIEAIGDDGAEAYPPFAVISAWVWALDGDAAKAQHSLETAERATFSGRPADGSASLESSIRVIRAWMAPFGIDQMLFDSQRAVELEPPGSPWHPVASWILGSAQLLQGDPELAAKAFERAAHFGRERQSPAVTLSLAQLSLLAAERGDWELAATQAADALDVILVARLQDYPPSMLSYAASANVAAHRGDRETALRNLGNALRLYGTGPTPVALPWHAVQFAIVVGRIFLDLDDVPAARQKVSEARRQLARLPTQGTLHADLQQLAGEVARRGVSPASASGLTFTRAELRVLHLLPTHLSLGEMGDELAVSRNTVKTQVSAVYRKLEAKSRADAVRRGRALGLLG
jgi:LuxR family maltose regulon positive regulatory protein